MANPFLSPEGERKHLIPSREEEVIVQHYVNDGDDDDVEDRKERRSTSCTVNTSMIPSKLCFFLNDSTHVLYSTYIIVFLTSVGLTVTEAGVISGLCLVAAAIAAPVWGYLTDCTGRGDRIFAVLVIGTSLCLFPSPWIAAAVKQTQFPSNNITLATSTSPSKPFTSRMFYTMLAVQLLCNAFLQPTQGFVVSFVMNIIKSRQKDDAEFGRQNLFGSIGIAITGLIAGVSVKHFTSPTLSPYTPVFIIHLVLCLLLVPVGLVTASQATSKKDRHKMKAVERLKILFGVCNLQNTVFMLTVVLAGLCAISMQSYLFQLMQDQMQGSKLVMGFASTVAAIGEIIVFFISKRIMVILRGPINCMMLSIFSYFARFLLLAFIESDWLVLPVQILHGFSFALFWVAATEYIYNIAKEEIYTTFFNTVISLYLNVGGLLGVLLCGMIYNEVGGGRLFQGMACLCAVWLIFMAVFYHIPYHKRHNEYKVSSQ